MELEHLESKIRELEEKYSKLARNYKHLYDYFSNNVEKVFTLAKDQNAKYREIYRRGSDLANEEIKLGWKEQNWSIGFTLSKRLGK